MGLTLEERRVLMKVALQKYKQAKRKKEKMEVIENFAKDCRYNHSYVGYLLRMATRRVYGRNGNMYEGSFKKKIKRERKVIYDEKVKDALIRLWTMFDHICSKRLKFAIGEVIEEIEINLDEETKEKLRTISPATIDRLLKGERKKYSLKSRSRTKPGTLLKHQIPIRTFSDWNETKPGYIEIDLVGHDGGILEGDFCYTLDAVDVYSGWSEQVCLRNKAQVWTFEGLRKIEKRLPFNLLGIDSDNGSEFINHHLKKYCIEKEIEFTRSRPYRKNDTCYVEQKNWSIVRRYAGYFRYSGERQVELLNEFYDKLRLYTNFFLPVMKQKEKIRDGTKIRKIYEEAKTPYRRLMESEHISKEQRETLKSIRKSLNFLELSKEIKEYIQKILRMGNKLNNLFEEEKVVEVAADNGEKKGRRWKQTA